jgi:hypothetical protein
VNAYHGFPRDDGAAEGIWPVYEWRNGPGRFDLFGEPSTAPVTAGLAAAFIWFWYGLPLQRWGRVAERCPSP